MQASAGGPLVSRQERRKLLRTMRKDSAAWPEELSLVPQQNWPPAAVGVVSAFWRSRHYFVQRYEERPVNGNPCFRLSINRVAMGADGRWVDGLSWDELMRCKRECGYGELYAVEVYPRDSDIENDANMRHLWVLLEPLPIGWF